MNEEETTTRETNAKKKRTILIASIAAGVLVLASGVTGGVYAYRQHEHSQAVSACTASIKPLRQAVNRLSTVQTSKDTTELVRLDVKKLADKTTHDKLTEAVKPVSASVALCEESLTTDQLLAREKANKKALAHVQSAHTQVEQAVNAMLKSRTMKSRTVLTDLVKSARGLVKDSQGKVADQKTLDSLNTTLTTADKLVQDKSVDYTKLDKQTADVQKAIDSVKASVEAKRKADEEAARKAEEERQAQAAAQAAQQRTYQAPARSYSAPRYQAPRYQAPRYQAPAQQNNNGGNSSESIDDLIRKEEERIKNAPKVCDTRIYFDGHFCDE